MTCVVLWNSDDRSLTAQSYTYLTLTYGSPPPLGKVSAMAQQGAAGGEVKVAEG